MTAPCSDVLVVRRANEELLVDLAERMPDKLAELQTLSEQEAARFGVHPVRDPGSPRDGDCAVPHVLDRVTSVRYTTAHVRMPEASVVNIKNCPFAISAGIGVPTAGAEGVTVCQGGNMAGWSLYLDAGGVPTYTYKWFGHEHTIVQAGTPLSPGRHLVQVVFAYDGGFGAGGDVAMLLDGSLAASGRIERTVPLVYSMSGETFDVGTDTGSPVGHYPHNYTCTARSIGVTIERIDQPSDEIAAFVRDGLFRADLRAHSECQDMALAPVTIGHRARPSDTETRSA